MLLGVCVHVSQMLDPRRAWTHDDHADLRSIPNPLFFSLADCLVFRAREKSIACLVSSLWLCWRTTNAASQTCDSLPNHRIGEPPSLNFTVLGSCFVFFFLFFLVSWFCSFFLGVCKKTTCVLLPYQE